MNLLLLDQNELGADGIARLDGRRARHVAEVLRVAAGDRIVVGIVGGAVGTARVVESGRDALVLAVEATGEPPPPSPVSLLLALPRPKILRKVLQAVASMGVKRLALLGTYRVEKSYLGSPLLEPAALEAELRLGLEQGRDTRLPVVSLHRFFKPFVEDELDLLFPPDDAARLVAHPVAALPLDALPVEPLAHGGGHAVVAIGPEGGFTPYEASTLVERGFAPVTLGPRPLRVDVAVPFAVAQAEMWLRGATRERGATTAAPSGSPPRRP